MGEGSNWIKHKYFSFEMGAIYMIEVVILSFNFYFYSYLTYIHSGDSLYVYLIYVNSGRKSENNCLQCRWCIIFFYWLSLFWNECEMGDLHLPFPRWCLILMWLWVSEHLALLSMFQVWFIICNNKETFSVYLKKQWILYWERVLALF